MLKWPGERSPKRVCYKKKKIIKPRHVESPVTASDTSMRPQKCERIYNTFHFIISFKRRRRCVLRRRGDRGNISSTAARIYIFAYARARIIIKT